MFSFLRVATFGVSESRDQEPNMKSNANRFQNFVFDFCLKSVYFVRKFKSFMKSEKILDLIFENSKSIHHDSNKP